MSGPKRNPDRLNTIGVVVVGICGAVLVYVTIVALEAFYVNDTSEVQTAADFGDQDVTAKSHKADEMRNITEAGTNGVSPGMPQTYRVKIDHAMELVVEDAKKDPSHLVPLLPPAQKATVLPIFGRAKALPTAAPAAPAPDAGSAAPTVTPTPTGSPTDKQPVPGAGGQPAGTTPTRTPVVPGGHAP